jgi:hypothetical protein
MDWTLPYIPDLLMFFGLLVAGMQVRRLSRANARIEDALEQEGPATKGDAALVARLAAAEQRVQAAETRVAHAERRLAEVDRALVNVLRVLA